ncbi:MAG TPA: hypothetical protein VFX50_04500, partial [Gemmatimonadales bacterium]|nr:hypothetical protein [Gemmatimonadales bacterium]
MSERFPRTALEVQLREKRREAAARRRAEARRAAPAAPKRTTTEAGPAIPRTLEPGAAIEAWFDAQGWTPFAFQREVWAAFGRGESGLVHAATGTGQTYAA